MFLSFAFVFVLALLPLQSIYKSFIYDPLLCLYILDLILYVSFAIISHLYDMFDLIFYVLHRLILDLSHLFMDWFIGLIS